MGLQWVGTGHLVSTMFWVWILLTFCGAHEQNYGIHMNLCSQKLSEILTWALQPVTNMFMSSIAIPKVLGLMFSSSCGAHQ